VFGVDQTGDRAAGVILLTIFSPAVGQMAGRRVFAILSRPLLDINTSIGKITAMASKFSDQLRRAIEQSGLSRYRISELTAIDQSQLSKFANGKAGLSIEAIDAICELIGAKLTTKQQPAKK
jgi:predicted XRE-type DNA-binding protein